MQLGQGWLSRCARGGLGVLLGLLPACALSRPQIDRAVHAEHGTAARSQGVAEAYSVACPDVLDITIIGHPELSGRPAVEADGRIALGRLGRIRVEGLGIEEIVRRVATTAELPCSQVSARVAEFKSQHIYVFGQIFGVQRAVPYQGPETVLDLLQRLGGVKPGAAAEDVAVVRSRVAEGRSPEVFRVDLQAITSGDAKTNVRLQPFDEVYVGETHRSVVARCVAPCLKPVCELLFGLRRPDSSNRAATADLSPPK